MLMQIVEESIIQCVLLKYQIIERDIKLARSMLLHEILQLKCLDQLQLDTYTKYLKEMEHLFLRLQH